MEIWIEGGRGIKQGPGPIITATGWTQTDRLNAAGEFSFSMPALDPRAVLVRRGYFARAWQFEEPGGWREVGYGRIEQMAMSAGPDGAPMLTVSGPNELGLLVDRLCMNANLRTYKQLHPSRVYHYIAASATNDGLTYVNDLAVGDGTTSEDFSTVITNTTDYLRVRASFTFDRITVNLRAANDNAATLTAKYFSGNAQDWAALTITDGTGTINVTDDWVALSQDGDITFTPPTDWVLAPGQANYEVRLYSSGTTNALRIYDISVWRWEGYDPATLLSYIMSFAPTGWSLDSAEGYTAVNQRALGAEVLSNIGFETGGTDGDFNGGAEIDDGDTDTFTDWLNNYIDAATGNEILAVSDSHSGSVAVKLTTGASIPVSYPVIYRAGDAVTAGNDYTLSFWTKGDGVNGQVAYQITASATGASYEDVTEAIDCGVTAATWTQISKTFTIPAGFNYCRVLFRAPVIFSSYAFVDDVSLKPGGGAPVYLQLRDESVLEALRRIASATNENFLRSPARRAVLWFGADVRDSGLRAIAADPAAGASAENVLLLTDLQELIDTSGLISRIYPYGGGMGAERVTLAKVTQPAPTGYTLNTISNYLERTAAVTALGVIETVQQWGDIAPFDTSETQAQYAANALMWQAWEYLETHSATDLDNVLGDVPRFYRATCVKSEALVLPGYTLRLSYHRFRDGLHAVNIDRDAWITAVTQSVGGDGAGVVGLELATVPRAAESDGLLVARNLIRLRNALAHNSAEAY